MSRAAFWMPSLKVLTFWSLDTVAQLLMKVSAFVRALPVLSITFSATSDIAWRFLTAAVRSNRSCRRASSAVLYWPALAFWIDTPITLSYSVDSLLKLV